MGYCMSEALCDVGLKAIAILDVLEEHGDAAVKALEAQFKVKAQFYKVDVRDEQMVADAVTRVRMSYLILFSHGLLIYFRSPPILAQ